MTLVSRASPQERRTEAFFDSWMRTTMLLTTEEMGTYAAVAAWIVKTGKPLNDKMAMHAARASPRKWRRLKADLIKKGAIKESAIGITIPDLEGRVYRTGYLYVKANIPSKLRWAVFRRDEYRCLDCGTHDDLTVDHIIPEIEGGQTVLDNLQTLCRACNGKKGCRL